VHLAGVTGAANEWPRQISHGFHGSDHFLSWLIRANPWLLFLMLANDRRPATNDHFDGPASGVTLDSRELTRPLSAS